MDNLQSSVTIYGSLSKPNSESSHSPISNRNTSQNKVCCQVKATSYEVGPGSMKMGWGQMGMDYWSQGLESREGAIIFKREQTGGSRRKQRIIEVVFNKQL